MKNNCNEQKHAFTLAEVLITLGIIGVVAAMTIPTLMNKTNDAELKSAYKETNSIIQQAVMLLINDNGGNISGVYTGDFAGSESFKNDLKQQLKYVKDCSGTAGAGGTGAGATADGCWASSWQDLTGATAGAKGDPGLVLANVAFVTIIINKTDCSFDMVPYNGNYKRCGYINVDVNGPKKPNTIGRDISNFNILPDRIVIEGALPVDPSLVCLAGGSGWDCGAKILSGQK